ncbi:ATPase [Tepiditoga spiralis]|uniref:ATPase n=1 Tax=Tepiditoga spiralis TaxID=2108365 RepID=A0A7G1G8Y8_9BACT|nr:P-loop NTPase fold protein [Tepiditoga spiralis]BBE31437.1 ATPase [Tepiditoga spiralis]
MENEKIRYIISNLYDEPLKDKKYMINRKNDLNYINKIIYYQPLGVYGICGETGVGKTTTLNFIDESNLKKFNILISEKESKESIIIDFLYKLSLLTLKESKSKKSKNIANEAKEFILNEKTKNMEYSTGTNAIIKVNYSKNLTEYKRYNIYTIQEYLEKLVNVLINEFKRVLIIIDELDKEKKEEILIILDSLKHILNKRELIVFISLPFSIYREYTNDRMKWNKTGNLENIFKDMIFLKPLKNIDISQMILKRLEKYPEFISPDSLKEIADYSEGNPRDALWITQQIILNNTEKNIIDLKTTKEEIKKIVRQYFKINKTLTENQKILIKEISNKSDTKNNIVKKLEKQGLKKQTVYTYINRLKDENIIKEKDGIFYIPKKILYALDI